jgi:hypothetical protein
MRHHPYVVTSPTGSVVASAGSSEAAHRASRRTNLAGSVGPADPDVAIRQIGSCQVCEGDFKLHGGRMVLHGYKRPGHGYILGDCMGVGEVPYEVSCDITKRMRDGVAGAIVKAENRLADLKEGRVHELTIRFRGGGDTYKEPKVYKRGDPNFEWKLRDAVSDVERDIYYLKRDHARLVKRVDAWQQRPIRTFEEERSKVEASKAERAQIVAEKRAVRDAKIAATKAKQADLVVRREAIAKDLAVKFRALADAGDVRGGQALARKQKKHMGWLYVDKLGVNAALVKLGLAKWRDDRKRFEDDVWVEHHYFG